MNPCLQWRERRSPRETGDGLCRVSLLSGGGAGFMDTTTWSQAELPAWGPGQGGCRKGHRASVRMACGEARGGQAGLEMAQLRASAAWAASEPTMAPAVGEQSDLELWPVPNPAHGPAVGPPSSGLLPPPLPGHRGCWCPRSAGLRMMQTPSEPSPAALPCRGPETLWKGLGAFRGWSLVSLGWGGAGKKRHRAGSIP